jgi:hypothetical protein
MILAILLYGAIYILASLTFIWNLFQSDGYYSLCSYIHYHLFNVGSISFLHNQCIITQSYCVLLLHHFQLLRMTVECAGMQHPEIRRDWLE